MERKHLQVGDGVNNIVVEEVEDIDNNNIG